MEQRIIFLDIDGTIAAPGSMEPVPSALEAMERAKAKGHKVVLCSGRSYDMLGSMRDFDYDAIVSNAGAHISCGGQVLMDYSIPFETLERVRSPLDEAGVLYTVICYEGHFSTPGYRDLILKSAQQDVGSELARWAKHFEHIGEVTLEEYRGQPVQKLIFISPTFEQLKTPMSALEAEFEFCVMGVDSHGITNGEIIHHAHSKGAAVQFLCRHWGLPLSASIAFGDSMNDASMLTAAGLGICMGNGSRELKALADEVCLPYDQAGVLRALEAHGLI